MRSHTRSSARMCSGNLSNTNSSSPATVILKKFDFSFIFIVYLHISKPFHASWVF